LTSIASIRTWKRVLLGGALLICTSIVVVLSQSRTSWIALVVLVIASLCVLDFSKKQRILFTLIVVLLVIVNYLVIDIIHFRVNNTITDAIGFFAGNVDTSTGIRIALTLLDIELIKQFPWFGIEDGVLPTYEELKSTVHPLTPEVYTTKLLAGSHSEVLGQFVRKGVIGGLLAVFGLFVFPIIYFFYKVRTSTESKFGATSGALVTIALLVSSLGIQIINLKMTSAFWATFLAIFFSSSIRASVGRMKAKDGRGFLKTS
jgi:O-antigen ligase